MANNPYAGKVPLHLRANEDKLAKSTSYRPGITHKVPGSRNQHDALGRNAGITYARRYPNGKLCVEFVAQQVVDAVHKAKDSGMLTGDEKALLSLILPGFFPLMDAKIAGTMFRMTDEERLLVALKVKQHMAEELNWNAGRGGGSVPGRSTSRS